MKSFEKYQGDPPSDVAAYERFHAVELKLAVALLIGYALGIFSAYLIYCLMFGVC